MCVCIEQTIGEPRQNTHTHTHEMPSSLGTFISYKEQIKENLGNEQQYERFMHAEIRTISDISAKS